MSDEPEVDALFASVRRFVAHEDDSALSVASRLFLQPEQQVAAGATAVVPAPVEVGDQGLPVPDGDTPLSEYAHLTLPEQAETGIAPDAMPLPAQDTPAMTELGDEALRDLIREVLRDEVRTRIGRRINQNIRRILREELSALQAEQAQQDDAALAGWQAQEADPHPDLPRDVPPDRRAPPPPLFRSRTVRR